MCVVCFVFCRMRCFPSSPSRRISSPTPSGSVLWYAYTFSAYMPYLVFGTLECSFTCSVWRRQFWEQDGKFLPPCYVYVAVLQFSFARESPPESISAGCCGLPPLHHTSWGAPVLGRERIAHCEAWVASAIDPSTTGPIGSVSKLITALQYQLETFRS